MLMCYLNTESMKRSTSSRSSGKGLALLLFYCILVMILGSCSTSRIAQDYQRDSVIVHIKDSLVLRDSLVMVPVPSGSATSILPDTDTSRLETDVAVSEAYVKDGNLFHSLRNKDALMPVRIVIPERIYTMEKEKALVRKEVETVEVEKQLSKWQNFIMSLGYVVLIAVVIWVIRTLYKYIKI